MGANALLRSLRLLMLIPFLGAMGYGLLMTKYTHEMQDGEPGFASNILLKVGAAWLDHSAGKTRDAVMDTAALNDDRVVRLSRTLPVAELPGGATTVLSPKRAEIAAFAMARQWADTECKAMVQTFATSCSFSTADVSIGDSGRASISVSLSFANDTPVGDTTGLDEASLIPQRVYLTEQRGIEIPPDQIEAEHAKIYAAAEAACAVLRAEKGTCVIASINFDQDPTEAGMIKLAASASIASLGTRMSATEILDLGQRAAAMDPNDPTAMIEALEAQTKLMEQAVNAQIGDLETGDAGGGSLFDRADQPRLQNTKGGAKFVTAP